MFNPNTFNQLQPGDKMVMQFHKGKPTWLDSQKPGSGAGAGGQVAGPGAGMGAGQDMAPPSASQPAAMQPAQPPPMDAQRQMLLQRMQQMGMGAGQ